MFPIKFAFLADVARQAWLNLHIKNRVTASRIRGSRSVSAINAKVHLFLPQILFLNSTSTQAFPI